jgi:hypothetical protein
MKQIVGQGMNEKPPLRLPRYLVEDGVAKLPPDWVRDPVSDHYVPPKPDEQDH